MNSHARQRFIIFPLLGLLLMGVAQTVIADGWNPTSKAGNRGSILNTRHNLTQRFTGAGGNSSIATIMDSVRNNYQEVCVYCHTPHGSNSTINAPLWNRTVNSNAYTIYDKPRTLNQPISQPGPNSLTCLSCHDGTISIDSIINMPGSGGYLKAQETSVNTAFLTAWSSTAYGNQNGAGSTEHLVLGDDPYSYDPVTPVRTGQCVFCHNTNGITATTPDYTVFAIGTNLRNDHPVGIVFPINITQLLNVDFNKPGLIYTPGSGSGKMAVFDVNGDSYPDKNEIRLYDSGDGFEVECASCHDPHGVPTIGTGSEFIPSFLRVSNGNANTGFGTPSGLCLTCHLK